MIPTKAFEIAQTVALFLAGHYDSHTFDDGYEDTTDYHSAARYLSDAVKRGELKFGFRKKVRASSGCYRTALIFDNFIVKFSRDVSRQHAIVSEYEFISKIRKNKRIGRHFPETHIVTVGDVTVQVQEKVDMSHRGASRDTYKATRLGEVMGLDDMHEGNFGWKGRKGREYPVFVDVDFRGKVRTPRKRKPQLPRSWELMVPNRSY